MKLAELLAGWTGRIERKWDAYVEDVPRAVAMTPAHDGYWRLQDGISFAAALAAPKKLAAVAVAIAPIVDRAVSEQDAEDAGEVSVGVVAMMAFANVVECTGGTLATATRATMVAWIPRVPARRDEKVARRFWSTSFAALALADRATYRRFTGVDHEREVSFRPGQTFGFNLQGLAAHLAGAIEQRAPIDAVMPAFEELLTNFPQHLASDSADNGTLLWIARVVYHRIGGVPLGAVAQETHDKVVEVAGAS